MAPPKNIILVGPMGSGKSTVARITAQKLGWRYLDLDRLIVEKAGMEIPDIFTRKGESCFRRWEREVLAAAVRGEKAVIATGGGAVMDPANLRAMKEGGVVVYLRAEVKELCRRLGKGKGRPLLSGDKPEKILTRLAGEREAYYRQADLAVDTAGLTPEEVADRVIALAAGMKKGEGETVWSES